MALHAGTGQRQAQNAGMVPEHFQGKAVLKMSLQEVQQFVQEQLAVNPALTMEDESRCPVCGCVLMSGFCPACGSEDCTAEAEISDNPDDWDEEVWSAQEPAGDDDQCEALSFVAASTSLPEYLKEQLRNTTDGEEIRIAEYIIDSLDDDGFLREPMIDIATGFGISVPQLEETLRLVQSLDPAGIAARDLRECLLLQIVQMDDDSAEKQLAEIIIRDYWEAVERMKFDHLASRLGVETEDVTEAMEFIGENLTPHPASSFRDPWEKLAPRREAKQIPDVIVRKTEDGLVAEIVDPVTGQTIVDETYDSLYAEIVAKKSGLSDDERAHIRECVQAARVLIESLEFRKSTLRRVVDELMSSQAGFIVNGSSYLRPLTRKELAHRLNVHESTVCRATDEKTMRLPSGEVISFDVFFDSALPVKELVRKLAAERPGGKAMSDNEIAMKLKDMGFEIARRTVAKYRSQLRVLPLDYRFAA